jgi:amicyanin
MNKKIVWVIVIVAVLLVGAGVVVAMQKSSDDSMSGMSTDTTTKQSTSSNSSTPAAATNTVSIENYAYSPASITVKKGTTVTWTNNDSVEHTVTVDSGSGPQSELFGKGKTYSYTFDTVGTFSYHCQPHPYMKGTVTVTE